MKTGIFREREPDEQLTRETMTRAYPYALVAKLARDRENEITDAYLNATRSQRTGETQPQPQDWVDERTRMLAEVLAVADLAKALEVLAESETLLKDLLK